LAKSVYDEIKAHHPIKALFEAGCKDHEKCETALGAECHAQLKADKKALSECHHEEAKQFHEIFKSVAACKDVHPHQHRQHHHEKPEHKKHEHVHKDYCKLGFDALVKDLEEHHKAHHHEDRERHARSADFVYELPWEIEERKKKN